MWPGPTAGRTNVLSSMDYELVSDLAEIYSIQKRLKSFDDSITKEISNVASAEKDKRAWMKMMKDIDTALTFAVVLKESLQEENRGYQRLTCLQAINGFVVC